MIRLLRGEIDETAETPAAEEQLHAEENDPSRRSNASTMAPPPNEACDAHVTNAEREADSVWMDEDTSRIDEVEFVFQETPPEGNSCPRSIALNATVPAEDGWQDGKTGQTVFLPSALAFSAGLSTGDRSGDDGDTCCESFHFQFEGLGGPFVQVDGPRFVAGALRWRWETPGPSAREIP